MGGLCNTVTGFASLFIVLAFAVAAAETFLVLWAKWTAMHPKSDRYSEFAGGADGVAKVLEALAKVLGALKDLPAWVAILLAGLALAWTATSAPHLCIA
jgi:hypothetical protein